VVEVPLRNPDLAEPQPKKGEAKGQLAGKPSWKERAEARSKNEGAFRRGRGEKPAREKLSLSQALEDQKNQRLGCQGVTVYSDRSVIWVAVERLAKCRGIYGNQRFSGGKRRDEESEVAGDHKQKERGSLLIKGDRPLELYSNQNR